MADDAQRALYEEFGELVHRHRQVGRRPMTQDQLGTLVGLSRTSITNIEKGRQRVSLHYIYRIAEALRVSPHMLLPQLPSEGKSELAQALPAGTEPEITRWADTLISG